MAILSFPSSGRLMTLTNRTNARVGACGVVIGPNNSRTVSLRSIQGHPDYMSELESLIGSNIITATLNGDILDATDADTLDAALSGDIWVARDIWTTPDTNDTNAYRLAFTAPAVTTTYQTTDLNGVVGQSNVDFARNVAIRGVCGGGESLTQKNVIIRGVDINGQALNETLTVSTGGQGGGSDVTYPGAFAFRSVTSLVFPADAAAPAGDYEVGFGKLFGFSRPLLQGGILAEFEDDAVPGVASTIVLSATGQPNGTFSPNNDPNGARTWVCVYIGH